MLEFALALLLFLVSHSIPARPALRQRLAVALGERTYLVLYSLLSLALLVWLISAATRAPYLPLWDPTLDQHYVPLLVMPPAFMLFIGALAPNPLSVSFSRRAFDCDRPGIVAVTRHPLLWGFALWAFAHIVPNGDLVSVIMFGGFGLFALAGMVLIDRRKRREIGRAEWEALARHTSLLPFAALIGGGARLRWPAGALAMTLAGSLMLYLLMLWAHPWLFGVDPKAVLP